MQPCISTEIISSGVKISSSSDMVEQVKSTTACSINSSSGLPVDERFSGLVRLMASQATGPKRCFRKDARATGS
jgi:hypothetical protein